MAKLEDLLYLVPGLKVVVSGCDGREHNNDAEGCVCALKGTTQTMGAPYEAVFAGSPTWYLEGTKKRVRLSEVTFVRPPP